MIQVASYCRVSTDKDDQTNSFEAQQRYFKEYIDRQPDWELYRVYADEGITGTSTKKRVQFNRMISDAKMGKFKLIITKEVSRFSRNILDTIQFTRELRAIGVGVLFMNDGISTLEPDAELRLSIMGSIAQEESRKTSSRVKWGQTRQMERGVVFGRSMLGYDVKDGKMTVNPEGAEIVRLIFHKYAVEGKGTSIIARELREGGFVTCTGNPKWNNTHIVKILKNEKYVGDLVQKKTYTPDYLTHAKKTNHGAVEKVILHNHHESIIDRDTWNIVQSEMKRRNRHGELSSGHGNRYLFSGKIKCGCCGASFVSRKKYRKDGSFYKRWSCFTAANEGLRHTDPMGNTVGCDIGQLLRDDFAEEILKSAIKSVQLDTKSVMIAVTKAASSQISQYEQGSGESTQRLTWELSELQKKKEDVLAAFFDKTITKEEMRMMNERFDRQTANLSARLHAARQRELLSYETASLKADVREHLNSLAASEQDESFLRSVLNCIVVHPDRLLELRLNLLPPKWRFVLDSMADLHRRSDKNGCHYAPSVPMSVSSPFRSSKGME